ncbi:MAG: hypothetical protein ACXACY_29515 [Candidatus Hodarchaeales archaeon]|jgi:hypothetical protein
MRKLNDFVNHPEKIFIAIIIFTIKFFIVTYAVYYSMWIFGGGEDFRFYVVFLAVLGITLR